MLCLNVDIQISVDFDTAPELPQLPEVTPRSDIPEVPEVKKDLKSRLMKMRSSFANPLFGNPATSGVIDSIRC